MKRCDSIPTAGAVVLTLLSLALPHPAPAVGQDTDRVRFRAHFDVEMGSRLDARLVLELREAAVREVLAAFGRILGQEPLIDPEIRGSVTIELHNVRAATALTAVCESVGCRWWIEDGLLKIEKDPEARSPLGDTPASAEGPSAGGLEEEVDMSLKDADLRQVLEAFGSIVGAPATIDPSLQGRLTIELVNTPLRQAIDATCRVQGCRWELVETAAGPVLRFTPAS